MEFIAYDKWLDQNPDLTADSAVCEDCDGKCQEKCQECDGDGTCIECHGIGDKCEICDGDGECVECFGTGWIGCETCNGQGYSTKPWDVYKRECELYEKFLARVSPCVA